MNDGDKALVIQDKILIDVAKDEMTNIVPLYYEMKKAKDEKLTPKNMYEALTSAYKANIGIISNDITKIWNNPNPDLRAVKWLTMFNNFTIDFAKTLFKPEHPEYAKEIIDSFTKNKLPHFFRYAKDKDYIKPDEDAEKEEERLHNPLSQVEEVNNSTVNRLNDLIPSNHISFKRNIGEIDYKVLMKRKTAPAQKEEIINLYEEMVKNKRFLIGGHQDKKNAGYYFSKIFKDKMKESKKRVDYIVDVLIEHLYFENGGRSKDILWDAYGDIIVENIKNNLEGTKCCENCLDRFKMKIHTQKYCKPCATEIDKENKKERNKRYYNKLRR